MKNTLRDAIHAENVKAGWWSDLRTGESILETRNRPEMLMLTVSEISEADAATGPDDKLPQYPGLWVELADIAIRVYDLAGAEDADVEGWLVTSNVKLMELVNSVSSAMEYYRKGRIYPFHEELGFLLAATYQYARQVGCPLDKIIDEKRAFNRERADHKPENRRAIGGKVF